MEVSYNQSQLEAAAYYLSTFHSDLHVSFESAQEFIINLINEYAADTETFYINSGGVQVCFSRPEFFVEIYVDPALMYKDGSDQIMVIEVDG